MTTARLEIGSFIDACVAMSPEITICVQGRHAIGKSEVVYQIAERLGLPVVERRLSQMTEGDLIGLPVMSKDKKATEFRPCDWLVQACENPVVLFLDERNRALQAVKQAVFQLADSRTIYGNVLHKDTRVFIAENIGGTYQVETNDPAEVSRCATVILEPTVEEWLSYARSKKIHAFVLGFVAANPKALEHTTLQEPNVKYPDRRSWFKLARELERANLFRNVEQNQMRFRAICQMMIGVEFANAFENYCLENDKRISIEEILKDWKKVETRLKGSEGIIPREYLVEVQSKVCDYLGTPEGKNLTMDQGFQVAEFARIAPPELVEQLLRSVAPTLGQHFQANNNTLDGLNPTTTKLCKHLQWRLAQVFQSGDWKPGEKTEEKAA